MPAHARHERAASGRPQSSSLPPLAQLHERIAALKVCVAAAHAGEVPNTSDQSMVPVFHLSGQPLETLCPDGDVKRRSGQILKILRERGALRLIGARAEPKLAEAIAGLYTSHPNFSAAVDYVLGEEALARQQQGAISGLRLLLHGSAGVGKSDYSLTLAKLLGVPAEVIGLSSSQAAAFLAGSEQFWSNTQPGLVWEQLIQGNFANPLFILDELDKVCDRWGDPLGALYQLLEPKTATVFCDKSIPWLPLDASYCNWIATANDVEHIHPALRSRFVEIAVTNPTEASLAALVQRLYGDLLIEFQLTSRLPPTLTDEQAGTLVGGSIRDAKRILRSAIARALRRGQSAIELPAAERPGATQRFGFIH